MKTAIVTDTNSSITPQEAKEMGIYLIPMPFFIDGETYLEGETCTHETFFHLLKAGAKVHFPAVSRDDHLSMGPAAADL